MGWRFSRNQAELWDSAWIGESLIGIVTIYVVWHLLQRYGQAISERLSITALLGSLLLCGVSMEVQGITVGMVIILLGFAGANRVLISLGIISLLFYISSYYIFWRLTSTMNWDAWWFSVPIIVAEIWGLMVAFLFFFMGWTFGFHWLKSPMSITSLASGEIREKVTLRLLGLSFDFIADMDYLLL